MKFGDRLKKLRKEKELTQAELGKVFSVSEAMISFLEENKRPPTYKLLNKIAIYFNITPEYLIGHDNIDRTIFANRLKELRSEKFINQPELGGAINVSASNISKYESGDSFPGVITLFLIADFFEVSIDYLLGRSDRKKIFSSEDEKIQKIGEQYLEMHQELKKMGLTPERTLEVIKKIYRAGLINIK